MLNNSSEPYIPAFHRFVRLLRRSRSLLLRTITCDPHAYSRADLRILRFKKSESGGHEKKKQKYKIGVKYSVERPRLRSTRLFIGLDCEGRRREGVQSYSLRG